jgi:hypothetical protein
LTAGSRDERIGHQPALIAQTDLCAEDGFDGFGCPQPAAVDLGEDLIQRLERPRHAEIGELAPEAIPNRGGGLHGIPPASCA